MSGLPRAVRMLAVDRAGGRCESCGDVLGGEWECHHRRARASGGSRRYYTDSVVNALVLHPHCHAWAHANPADARLHGWFVSQWEDPSQIPVIFGMQPRYPHLDGSWQLTPDVAEPPGVVAQPARGVAKRQAAVKEARAARRRVETRARAQAWRVLRDELPGRWAELLAAVGGER